MRLGVLACADEDQHLLQQVAIRLNIVLISFHGLPEALSGNIDALFVGCSGDASAHDPLEAVRKATIPVVFVSSSSDLRRKALAAGASDTLIPPLDAREIEAEISSLDSAEGPAESFQRAAFEKATKELLVGISPAFKKCVDELRKVAFAGDHNVLILGETGTGKEVFARALHRCSNRSSEPFLGVNCAALPEGLVESELFGSRKGAFSTAENKMGQFEAVSAGTLLLDEIGELPMSVQPKLLRAIQEREFLPLGGVGVVRFHGRLIAATLVDLGDAGSKGRFRTDLAARLDQLRIRLPPLRHRREDIPLLARHILRAKAPGRPLEISFSTMRMLEEADYPENIRQLENVLIKAIAEASPSTTILPRHLPRELFEPRKTVVPGAVWKVDETLPYAEARDQAQVEVDRVFLGHALQEHNHKIIEAAPALGIDRKTFGVRWKRATGKEVE